MNARLVSLLTAIAITVISLQAQATVLTFTDAGTNYWSPNSSVALPTSPQRLVSTLPLYGDHVSSFTESTADSPNAYSYGTGHGLTPNIGVAYGPGSAASATSAGNQYPVWFPGFDFYSPSTPDPSNVIYQLESNGIFNITLTADPTYQVQLYGFELAVDNENGGAAKTVDSLDVIVDGIDHILPAAAVSSTELFSFATPYTGSTIEILLTTTTQPEWIGIGDVDFGQMTPEPASLGLLVCGSVLLLRRKRA